MKNRKHFTGDSYSLDGIHNHQDNDIAFRNALSDSWCPCDGTCPRCHETTTLGNPARTELQISKPGDASELEADKVAEQIMQVPINNNPSLPFLNQNEQASPTHPSHIESDDDHANEHLSISQKSWSTPNSYITDETANEIINVNTNAGSSIDSNTKEFMESRFGHNFSNVKIHDDVESDNLASLVNARAFTSRNHIFLSSGESKSNKKLLAHELTHVIQQGSLSRRLHVVQRVPSSIKYDMKSSAPAKRIFELEDAYRNYVSLRRNHPTWYENPKEYQEAFLRDNSVDPRYNNKDPRFSMFAKNVELMTDIFGMKTKALANETLRTYEAQLKDHEEMYKSWYLTMDLWRSLQIMEDLPTLAKLRSEEPEFLPESEIPPALRIPIEDITQIRGGYLNPKFLKVTVGAETFVIPVTADGQYMIVPGSSKTNDPIEEFNNSTFVPNPFIRNLEGFVELGFTKSKEQAKDWMTKQHPMIFEEEDLISTLSGRSSPEQLKGWIDVYIESRRKAIKELRGALLEDVENNDIYKFENLISASYDAFKIDDYSVLKFLIVDYKKRLEKKSFSIRDFLMTVFYIAAGIFSAFFPVFLPFLALGVSAIETAFDAYKAHKEFNVQNVAYRLGFTDIKPSNLSLVTPYLGFGIDLATFRLGSVAAKPLSLKPAARAGKKRAAAISPTETPGKLTPPEPKPAQVKTAEGGDAPEFTAPKPATSPVWELYPGAKTTGTLRGDTIEDYIAKYIKRLLPAGRSPIRRLPKPSFPTGDFVEGGTSTVKVVNGKRLEVIDNAIMISEKSLDLRIKSFQTEKDAFKYLTKGSSIKYEKLKEFTSGTYRGIEIRNLSGKRLIIRYGPGSLTDDQLRAFERFRNQAAQEGVDVIYAPFSSHSSQYPI